MLDKIITIDKFKFEALARLCAMCIIGISLSVADLPTIVPPSAPYLVGLWTTAVATGVPKLLFVLLGVIPSLVTLIFITLMFTTAILACYTYSVRSDIDADQPNNDVFMVVMYAIYILFVASFFFGENYQKTSGTASTLCALVSMLVLSYYPLLEDGSVTVSDLWTQTGVDNPLAVIQNMLISIGWMLFALVVGVILPPP